MGLRFYDYGTFVCYVLFRSLFQLTHHLRENAWLLKYETYYVRGRGNRLVDCPSTIKNRMIQNTFI